MLYSYDNYGWHSSQELVDRQTSIAPPDINTIPNGYAANFTGYSWIIIPYIESQTQSPEELWGILGKNLDEYMDHKVFTEKKYKSMESLCSYINSNNLKWKEEAAVGIVWRDLCWEYFYSRIDLYIAGSINIPTISEIINNLPELIWPE